MVFKRKFTKLIPVFHSSIFNYKGTMVILFLSFHFSISFVKYTWWKIHIFYHFSIFYSPI